MRAAGRNVIIKPLEDEILYQRIIALPDTARAKSNEGVVLSIGEWCRWVQPGDHVIFSRRQAADVEHNGEMLTIVDERAIIVTLHEEDEDGS